MNKDQVKGAVNDAAGRAKRQVGEWTGNTDTQVEGSVQQAKGKAQKAWGNVKEAAKDAQTDAEREKEAQREREREREQAHSGRNR
jgi:uncharacterized protein YjbJ (UPF0337 family)